MNDRRRRSMPNRARSRSRKQEPQMGFRDRIVIQSIFSMIVFLFAIGVRFIPSNPTRYLQVEMKDVLSQKISWQKVYTAVGDTVTSVPVMKTWFGHIFDQGENLESIDVFAPDRSDSVADILDPEQIILENEGFEEEVGEIGSDEKKSAAPVEAQVEQVNGQEP